MIIKFHMLLIGAHYNVTNIGNSEVLLFPSLIISNPLSRIRIYLKYYTNHPILHLISFYFFLYFSDQN